MKFGKKSNIFRKIHRFSKFLKVAEKLTFKSQFFEKFDSDENNAKSMVFMSQRP